MSSTGDIPGYSKNTVRSAATDPTPPKSRLQGDSDPAYVRPLIYSDTQATSRGGNTKAPGGRLVPPKAKPNGTSGGGVKRNLK